MKKSLVGASLLMIVLSSACQKEDPKLINTWTINGTTYTVSVIRNAYGQMNVADVAGNTCTFTFKSASVAPEAGTYKIVAGPTPGDHELIITALKKGSPQDITYESVGAQEVNATITRNGADVTIAVPEIAVQELNTVSSAARTARFSAYQITTR